MADASLTYRKRPSTKGVILHASHTAEHETPNLEAWLRVTGRKMGLLEIGYHYVIFQDGRQLCTRPHDVIGSHTPGFNKEWIGIVLQGGIRFRPGEDGEELRTQADTFTDPQMETLSFIFRGLRQYYGELDLKGHTELGRHKLRRQLCPPISMDSVRELCLQ